MRNVTFHLRNAVARLAIAINNRLDAKAEAHGGDTWDQVSLFSLSHDLATKAVSLNRLVRTPIKDLEMLPADWFLNEIKKRSTDVAFYAMAILDNYGLLPDVDMAGELRPEAQEYDPQGGLIYISGPMTGLPDFNIPAFNEMAALLRSQGHECVNPADGGPTTDETSYEDHLRRDFADMLRCNALVVLPGWEKSNGATFEVAIARQLKMPVYTVVRGHINPVHFVELPDPKAETILEEAQRLIFGDRRQDYGHPLDDYTRTAGMVNAAFSDKLKAPLTAEDIMLMMILVKISRQRNHAKRDNLTDMAGYAGCIQEAADERQRRLNAA